MIKIGRIKNNDEIFHLNVEDFKRHACIFGMTGSGKSTTMAIIAYELMKNDIASLIIDRTGEFRNKMIKLNCSRIYYPGYNLNLSPFDIWEEENFEERIQKYLWLLDEFCKITWKENLSPLQNRLIFQALYRLAEKGSIDFTSLINECRRIAKEELKLWIEAAEAIASRFGLFSIGKFKKAFTNTSISIIDNIFEKGIHVVDLSNLEYEAPKNLFSLIISNLIMLKLKREGFSNDIKIAFMIDEAHNIAGKDIKFGLIEKIAMELRKYGMSLIIASPNPSEINPRIIANAGLLIAHQILSSDEIEVIKKHAYTSSYYSGFEEIISNLKVGEAFVRSISKPEGEIIKIGIDEHSFLIV